METSLSLGHDVPSPSPSRVSPIGSSKRKSKPVKRIVENNEEATNETTTATTTTTTLMGNAAAETVEATRPRADTREQPSPSRAEDLVKPVTTTTMDHNEMLRKLAELLGGGQVSSPPSTANLFSTSFPTLFPAGCPVDLSHMTNTEALAATTLPNILAMSFPNMVNTTPTNVTTASAISAERYANRTPTASVNSLANSKGPVKRKLFESGREMNRAVATGISKEERIDLDDLENFAQMFKKQRIKFGFTQGDVGVALGRRYGTDFSQTTISRFEALNLSFKNMCKLRPLLKEWLTDAEAAIANGASLNDLLERPSSEKSAPKNDSPVPVGDGTMLEPVVKRRRKRTNLDVAQRTTLDAYFAMNPRPDHERMTEIANLLELDRDVVRVWFCNRRQKMRRADEPESSEDPLLSSLRAIAQTGDFLDDAQNSS